MITKMGILWITENIIYGFVHILKTMPIKGANGILGTRVFADAEIDGKPGSDGKKRFFRLGCLKQKSKLLKRTTLRRGGFTENSRG